MSQTPSPPRSRLAPFDRMNEAPRAYERSYGTGVYRRRILVRRLDANSATGELEDDFHHFRVDLRHDGTRVTEIAGSGVRSPWTVCLSAGDPLQAVVGAALATGPSVLRMIDAHLNCTHMFDLTGLLIAHVARGTTTDRLLDMEITDNDPVQEDRHARLWRDGDQILDWHLDGRTVLGPPEWVGAPLWDRFIDWAAKELDDDLAEAAVALRRAADISRGRLSDLDEVASAEHLLDLMADTCHAFQPEQARLGIRRKGTGRDFTDNAELLLADFDSIRE